MKIKMALISISVVSVILAGCSPLYYGYLPGTEYKILKPLNSYDFKNQTINPVILDTRENIQNITCSNTAIDRKTELEGNIGLNLFSEAITKTLSDSKFKIDTQSAEKYTISLEAISFQLLGFVYIVPHGFVQFRVEHAGITKTYCSDMIDADKDSPLKWYSLETRKSATRAIVSGSLRRAVENFLKDLQDGKYNQKL